MAWDNVKKSLDRASTSILLKTGYIDKTVDKQFDAELKNLLSLQTKTTDLQRHAKNYLDSLRQVKHSHQQIIDTLSAYYYTEDENILTRPLMLDHYVITVAEMHDNATINLDQQYRETVLAPIMKFLDYFADIDEAVIKRNKKKNQYDIMRNKVSKLTTADDKTKDRLLSDLASMESIYQTMNNQIKNDIPKLINLRVDYLESCFESFVKIQLKHCNDTYMKLNNIQTSMPKNSRDDYANGVTDDKIDDILSRMSQLSITSNSQMW